MRKLLEKALRAWAWARTPTGKRDIGILVGVLGAIYDGLHRAGAI